MNKFFLPTVLSTAFRLAFLAYKPEAGAVVTKDVPANTIVGGVPAKIIKQTEV